MNPSARIEKLADEILKCALGDGPIWDLAEAVEVLVDRIARNEKVPRVDEVRVAVRCLNSARHFALAQKFAGASRMHHGLDATVAKCEVQALINQGKLEDAQKLLGEAVEAGQAVGASAQFKLEASEFAGLAARIQKDRFVATGDADQLVSATDAYLKQYQQDDSPFWHGVNAVALFGRQERMGLKPAHDHVALAREIQASLVAKRVRVPQDFWILATLSELGLALGECEQAELWLYRFLFHPATTPFAIDSYQRQLREIWEGNLAESQPGCADRLVGIIARHQLQRQGRLEVPLKGAGGRQALTDAELHEYERNFSGEAGFSFNTLRKVIGVCDSIGCVSSRTGTRLGTGFLLKGSAIDPDWDDEPVFVTNAHVISDSVSGAVPPKEALVCFEVESIAAGKPDYRAVTEVLFSSGPGPLALRSKGDLDVTVVRLEKRGKTGALPAAQELPLVTPKTRSYVVGHPNGGGLQVSLHDSKLLDIDDDKRLLHYRTPTDPGSSGSPVFNSDWEVIAVHHGGSAAMPRLRGSGSYEANEGISLTSIRSYRAAAKLKAGPTG